MNNEATGTVTTGWAQPGAHGKREPAIVYASRDGITIVRRGTGRRIIVNLDLGSAELLAEKLLEKPDNQ